MKVTQVSSKMHEKLFVFVILILPSTILCCKSTPSSPPIPTKLQCPDGYWKVPDGYKCFGPNLTNCVEDEECISYDYLCNGDNKMDKFVELGEFEAVLFHNGHEYKDEFKTKK